MTTPRKPVTREELTRLMEMKVSDREAGVILGCSARYMPALRKKHGIPPRKNGRPFGSRNSDEARARQGETFKRNREMLK